MTFEDRRDAGRQLAVALTPYRGEDCIILALPRGGVPVAAEIAADLEKPLDVLVVRKLGAPGQPELGVGAIAPNGIRVFNRALIQSLGLLPDSVERLATRETSEMERRIQLYRGTRAFPDLTRKTVILVDDGLATGASARAAIAAARAMKAGKIVLAIPVGAHSSINELSRDADDLVCLRMPDYFESVSLWYRRFPQISDSAVTSILTHAWGEEALSTPGDALLPP